jgi:hypothetical protein
MAQLTLSTASWFAADTRLRKGGRSRDSVIIGRNTSLERLFGGRIGVVLYFTTIMTLHAPDSVNTGWLSLAVNGWDSATTRQRLNALLPGPWAVGSHRTPKSQGGDGYSQLYLFWYGVPVLAFRDGLAVRADAANGDAVGFPLDDGTIGVLYDADGLKALRAARDAADAVKAAARVARLAKQHPVARPVTYRADVPHGTYSHFPMARPHGPWGVWDCPACVIEQKEWAAIRADALRATHPNGHAWTDGIISFPVRPCPWDCPSRNERTITA